MAENYINRSNKKSFFEYKEVIEIPAGGGKKINTIGARDNCVYVF